MTVVVFSESYSQIDLICDHLQDRGHAPLPAPDAFAASRLCRYVGAEALVITLPSAEILELLRGRVEDPDLSRVGTLALIDRAWDAALLSEDPELGVDDILRRPFSLDVMTTRLEAIVRRRHPRVGPVVRLDGLVIDPPRRKVTVDGREVRLARKEFDLLRCLASDPTRVFQKEELLRDVWGIGRKAASSRTLDSHASRLRRRLDPEGRRYVLNCWGIGYKLLDSVGDAGSEGGGEDR